MAPSKAIKDDILGDVVVLIDEAHAEACAKGNSTYGINNHMIKEQQKDFLWINRNVINYFKKDSRTTAIKHVNLPPLQKLTTRLIGQEQKEKVLNTGTWKISRQ